MRSSRLLVVAVVLAAFALALCAQILMAQDLLKVAPGSKLLLDNKKVRVIEVQLKPGEKLAMHSHPAHIVYYFTAGSAKSTTADGKVTERQAKAGEAIWNEATKHSIENGKRAGHALVIEIK